MTVTQLSRAPIRRLNYILCAPFFGLCKSILGNPGADRGAGGRETGASRNDGGG